MSEPIKLTGKLLALASYIGARRGRFIEKRELMTNVFGMRASSKSRTVDAHLQRLLGVLGDSEEIMTCRSRRRSGYVLVRVPGGEL